MAAQSRHRAHWSGTFERFVHSEVTGSAVLLVSTGLALALANSPWAATYHGVVGTRIGVWFGNSSFSLNIQQWINDLLMVVFFFVVGLEIKRELVVGQLSSRTKATLPAMAALGGMVVPALLYATFNAGGAGSRGWGIPMATDIAFALGMLSLFGRRVPVGLRVFLAALAIADDLGAVLVIAVFYTDHVVWPALGGAAVLLALVAMAGRVRIRQPAVYVLLATGVWACVFASGVHPTVAGVLVAMVVPVRSRRNPDEFLALAEGRLTTLRATAITPTSLTTDREQADAVSDLHEAAGDMRPPGLALEEMFHPFVVFVILPLFAFFNAGVTIDGSFHDMFAQPVGLGIVLGLVLGKQIGIMLFSWVAVRTGQAELPAGVSFAKLYGVACLAGIGFTMSLFVTELAFGGKSELLVQAKVAILAASLAAAVVGAIALSLQLRGRTRRA
jgi:NhaA family Na+:H+ antiporter